MDNLDHAVMATAGFGFVVINTWSRDHWYDYIIITSVAMYSLFIFFVWFMNLKPEEIDKIKKYKVR